MNILYLGNFLNNVKGRYDGPNVQVVGMLRELGHKVICAGTSGAQIIRFWQFTTAIFIGKLKGLEFIIVDVFSTKAFYFAVVSGKLATWLGIKYGLVLHGGNLPARFNTSESLSKGLLNDATLVSSPSNYLAEAANSKFGIRVVVIPNKIDVEPFRLNDGRLNELFWVRSLGSVYNPEMAVEVLKLLNEKGFDFKLFFIGPGDTDRIHLVKELVVKYQLDSYVFFKGKLAREEWHNLAKRGKYFLNTTTVDNTPSSVIEAMALGLIPISTNVGGLPFILNSWVDSVLVDKGDSEAMASAIERLELQLELRESLQKKGWSKFDKVYHSHVIKGKWEETLNSHFLLG